MCVCVCVCVCVGGRCFCISKQWEVQLTNRGGNLMGRSLSGGF